MSPFKIDLEGRPRLQTAAASGLRTFFHVSTVCFLSRDGRWVVMVVVVNCQVSSTDTVRIEKSRYATLLAFIDRSRFFTRHWNLTWKPYFIRFDKFQIMQAQTNLV